MAVAVVVVIAGTALDYIYAGSSVGTSELLVIKLNHHTGPSLFKKQHYTNTHMKLHFSSSVKSAEPLTV